MCEPPSCIRVCYISNSKCRLNATLTPRHDYPAPGLFTGLVATHRLVAATNAHGLARPSARVMYARPHFSGCLLREPHHLGGESARRSVLPASSAGSTGATPRVVFARAPPRRRRGPLAPGAAGSGGGGGGPGCSAACFRIIWLRLRGVRGRARDCGSSCATGEASHDAAGPAPDASAARWPRIGCSRGPRVAASRRL